MAEKFSLHNTLNEVMNNAGPAMSMFFHKSFMQFVPEDLWDASLEEIAEKVILPWGADLHFPSAELVEDANRVEHADELWELIPLWVKPEDFCPGTGAAENVSLMKLKSCEMDGIRPAVIVCPGGGYENLAFRGEGIEVAERFAAAGIRPFILTYRFNPNRYPAPQTDLALAVKYLRANAASERIDPNNLTICGFSAGGHLCASFAANRDEIDAALMAELRRTRPDLAEAYAGISVRPDKVVLGYPVISFMSEAHEGSFQALTGGDETLREHLSVERQVDETYPKTFAWACADDSLVPASNTTRLGEALAAKGVPHEVRIYPEGEHGCVLGAGTSAAGWFDEMLAFMQL